MESWLGYPKAIAAVDTLYDAAVPSAAAAADRPTPHKNIRQGPWKDWSHIAPNLQFQEYGIQRKGEVVPRGLQGLRLQHSHTSVKV